MEGLEPIVVSAVNGDDEKSGPSGVKVSPLSAATPVASDQKESWTSPTSSSSEGKNTGGLLFDDAPPPRELQPPTAESSGESFAYGEIPDPPEYDYKLPDANEETDAKPVDPRYVMLLHQAVSVPIQQQIEPPTDQRMSHEPQAVSQPIAVSVPLKQNEDSDTAQKAKQAYAEALSSSLEEKTRRRRRDKLKPPELDSYEPTAPAIWFKHGRNCGELPVINLHTHVSVHVDDAIVSMTGKWANTTGREIQGLFVVPTSGFVSRCQLIINNQTMVNANYVPRGDSNFEGMDQSQDRRFRNLPSSSNVSEFTPDLFQLPVLDIPPNAVIDVNFEYVEKMDVLGPNRMGLTVPLTYPGSIIGDKDYNSVLQITGEVDSVCTARTFVKALGYNLDAQSVQQRIFFRAYLPPDEFDKGQATLDFNFYYEVETNKIQTTLIKKTQRIQGRQESGWMNLYVQPPGIKEIDQNVPRNIVFLLDQSGSMAGSRWRHATSAISDAIRNLRKNDSFALVLFNKVINSFSVNWTGGDDTEGAISWLNGQSANGGTDIDMALMQAYVILAKKAADTVNNFNEVNMIFMVSDGKVYDENDITYTAREIVDISDDKDRVLESMKKLRAADSRGALIDRNTQPDLLAVPNLRISTLGIGYGCNGIFLKKLAAVGRGEYRRVFRSVDIDTSVKSVMRMVSTPLLVNLRVEVPNAESVTFFPEKIPDLTADRPVSVSCRYVTNGPFPNSVVLRGTTPAGDEVYHNVYTTVNAGFPLERLVAMKEVDHADTEAWLTGAITTGNHVYVGDDARPHFERAQALSVKHRVPSVYTMQVAQTYPVNEHARRDEQRRSDNAWYKNKAALGGVGLLVLGGSALVAFGMSDIAASSYVSTGNPFSHNSSGCGCDCGDCSICDCMESVDCCRFIVDCCDACGVCNLDVAGLCQVECCTCFDCGNCDLLNFNFIGDCCQLCCDVFGDCCTGMCCEALGGVGNCFSECPVGDCLEGIFCDGMGECCSGLGDCAGGLCDIFDGDCISGLCECFCEGMGSACEVLECVGAICEGCGGGYA